MRDLFSELYGQRKPGRDRYEELISNEEYYAREDRLARRERKLAQKFEGYCPPTAEQIAKSERTAI